MKQSILKGISLTILALMCEGSPVLGQEKPSAGDVKAPDGPQPYSADETTEQSRILPDGTRSSTIISTAHVYRDSKGRTRREVSFGDTSDRKRNGTAITISDVVAGERYELDPKTRIAYHETLTDLGTKRGGRGDSPEGGRGGEGERHEGGRGGEGERHEGGHGGEGERHEGGRGGEGDGRESTGKNKGKRNHEDLGFKMIQGLNAHGSRNTFNLGNGTEGNVGAIMDERWVAVDLGIVVKSTHTDPRTGETVLSITNVKRFEPEASLFQVPKGYSVKQQSHDK